MGHHIYSKNDFPIFEGLVSHVVAFSSGRQAVISAFDAGDGFWDADLWSSCNGGVPPAEPRIRISKEIDGCRCCPCDARIAGEGDSK
jgi:hypothetical protein